MHIEKNDVSEEKSNNNKEKEKHAINGRCGNPYRFGKQACNVKTSMQFWKSLQSSHKVFVSLNLKSVIHHTDTHKFS